MPVVVGVVLLILALSALRACHTQNRYAAGTKLRDDFRAVGDLNDKTKAQIIEYLKGSFASLHRAAAALNENNMAIRSRPRATERGF